jgi:hypothetical protein
VQYPDAGTLFLRRYPATGGAGSHTPTLNPPKGAWHLSEGLACCQPAGITQPAIATKWTVAAAMTSAWKTSWKPKVLGHGFGRRRA